MGCKPEGEGGQGPPAGQWRSMCEEHGEAQGQQLLLLPSKLLLRSGRPGSSRPRPTPAASPALLQLALHVAPLQPLHAAPQREAPGARLRLASRVLPSKAARVHSDRYCARNASPPGLLLLQGSRGALAACRERPSS